MNTKATYGFGTKCLHWTIVILLMVQLALTYLFVNSADNSPEKMQYMMLHKSTGLTVLLIALLFVIWKIFNVSPIPPVAEPRWRHLLAKSVHHTLLLLIIIMPLLGYSLSCAAGRVVSYFGWFTLPCLLEKNQALASILDSTHATLGFVLFILIGLHVIAAFYHHVILKDNILKRMF